MRHYAPNDYLDQRRAGPNRAREELGLEPRPPWWGPGNPLRCCTWMTAYTPSANPTQTSHDPYRERRNALHAKRLAARQGTARR